MLHHVCQISGLEVRHHSKSASKLFDETHSSLGRGIHCTIVVYNVNGGITMIIHQAVVLYTVKGGVIMIHASFNSGL